MPCIYPTPVIQDPTNPNPTLPSHAIAHAMKIAPEMGKDQIMIVNLSGRGDKDVHTVAKMLGMEI